MRKPKTLRPIHANRGVEAKYRKALMQLIDEMQNSIEYWLQAAYRKEPPKMVVEIQQAQDATPSQRANKAFKEVAKRWTERFEEVAPKIAESFATGMFKASDIAFTNALKESGFAVKFTMTPAMSDALQASISENVGLIKSIPERYLYQVQGIVMRSYTSGRDLATMVKDLKELYPKNADRAVLIARDQSNKANAVVNRARQLEIGITQALWMHSHAGKNPRPDHVAADGKPFDVAKGCLISGEYIQPGEKINCRCTSRAILPTSIS
jgi:SPP1 gp7 family putative phage head morphogenesis protein